MRKNEILKFEAKKFWRGQIRDQAKICGQAKIWGQANFEAKSEARPGFRVYRIFIADTSSFSSGNNPFLVNRESSVVHACHLLCVET